MRCYMMSPCKSGAHSCHGCARWSLRPEQPCKHAVKGVLLQPLKSVSGRHQFLANQSKEVRDTFAFQVGHFGGNTEAKQSAACPFNYSQEIRES